MSCERCYRSAATAAGYNGVSAWLSRSLGAIGSWGTVNAAIEGAGGITLDLKDTTLSVPQSASELTQAVARMATNAALDTVGLSLDKDQNLKMKNAKGLLIAAHALEQATASVVTLGARQLVRGKPYLKYQGVLVRKNPLIRKMTAHIPRYTRGRITPQPESAYYFHRDGVTWSSTATRYNVFPGEPKTMAGLKSLGIPGRSYYFDRALDAKDAIDIVVGDKNPETIPGFLGSTTEIDSLVGPLRRAKKTLMGLNWLTVDDSERDVRRGRIVDYDRVFTRQKKDDIVDYRRLAGEYRAMSYRDLLLSGERKEKKKEEPLEIAHTIDYQALVDEVGEALVSSEIKMPGYNTPRPLRIHALDELRSGTVLAEADFQAPDGEWFPIVDRETAAGLGKLVLDKFEQKSRAQYTR